MLLPIGLRNLIWLLTIHVRQKFGMKSLQNILFHGKNDDAELALGLRPGPPVSELTKLLQIHWLHIKDPAAPLRRGSRKGS